MEKAQLEQALQLSRELLLVAEGGDVQAAVHLDAERRRLLESVRAQRMSLGEDERLLLEKIGQLNDQAIGLLEHRHRIKARELDTASAGRHAMVAYSATMS